MSSSGIIHVRVATTLVLAGLFSISNLLAQQSAKQLATFSQLKALDAKLIVQWDKKTGVPRRLKGKLSQRMTGTAQDIAKQFFRSNAALYRMTDADHELRLLSVKKGAGNWEHVRMQQQYGSIPVEGNVMLLHIAPDRVVEEVQGEYVPIATLDTTTRVRRDQAVTTSLARLNPKGTLRKPTTSELVIYRPDTLNHLTWKVRIQSQDPLGDFIYYVDAQTGKVLDWYDNLKRSLYRKTYDANHGTIGILKRSEGDPPTGDAVLNTAHDHVGTAYNFFRTTFGRDSWDDHGDTLRSIVHYQTNYNNAFWDGSSLTYGDGDGIEFSPLCQALDVVTHELTHGVTQAEGDLVYRNQSGALNESYSDIFGVLIDPPDWMIGEDCFTPGTPGDALRYMDDPPKGDQPDHMSNYLSTTDDNGGVHTNSGIPNKAAYLMAQGGTHHGVTVPGIGRFKVAKIFYGSYAWLTPTANFNDAREATMQAARVEFPADTVTVDRAWRAVGVFAIELSISPADQVHPDPNGGTKPVAATIVRNGAPVSGVLVLFSCDDTGIATVSPTSGTTDPQGTVSATVTGHQRGNTPLHVSAVAGSDSAFGSVPVKVPVGSWPAMLAFVSMMVITTILRGRCTR